MTAPALNTAFSVSPGPRGPNAAAKSGGAAGFDALMAALFPQPTAGQSGPEPVPAADAAVEGEATGAASLPTPLLANLPAAVGADPGAQADEAIDPPAPGAGERVAEVATAPLVDVGLPQSPPLATETPSKTNASDAAPPAWGRDKAKGAPAQPALQNANANARFVEDAATDADALTTSATEVRDPRLPAPAADAAQQRQVQKAASAQAGSPTLSAPLSGAPPADAAPDAAVDTAPATALPIPADKSVDAVPTAANATTVAQSLSRPESAAARPTRSERRAQTEEVATASDANATPATVGAKAPAATGLAAKTLTGAEAAPSAEASAADPETLDVDTWSDGSDSATALDSKPAGQADVAASAAAGAPVRGSPETVAHLAAQILKKLDGRSTRFDVELNPEGLGKVDVRIEIGAQGRMTAAMVFDNGQAAHDLKARASELQRALEQAGFDLSGGLSFDVANDQGQGRQQHAWQDAQGELGNSFRGQAFRAALDNAGEADVAVQGALRLRRGVNAGLDVRI